MMRTYSVGELYPLAMAEGEGVGTAYEYLTKRLALAKWLRAGAAPERMLIAGLPEKYGSSLDFALVAHEYDAELLVVDERPEALARFGASLAKAQAQGYLSGLKWQGQLEKDLGRGVIKARGFELALSSEVLQRVETAERQAYVTTMRETAGRAAIFCPNGDNQAHVGRSGLVGVTLEALTALTVGWAGNKGFIDMPPFPPGLTRSDEQREQAATGRLEALVMSGLGIYARMERLVPGGIRRSQSHIVFALSDPA